MSRKIGFLRMIRCTQEAIHTQYMFSLCVGYSRGTSMWKAAFGTGHIITCEAGSAPVNYSNVWMGHGVCREKRGGGETIVSSVASLYISANTGGWWLFLPLQWSLSTFRGHPGSPLSQIKYSRGECLNMSTNDADCLICSMYTVLDFIGKTEGTRGHWVQRGKRGGWKAENLISILHCLPLPLCKRLLYSTHQRTFWYECVLQQEGSTPKEREKSWYKMKNTHAYNNTEKTKTNTKQE